MKIINSKVIYIFFSVALILNSGFDASYSAQESIGRIGNINRSSGEIIVNISSTGGTIEMGELIFIKLGNDIVVLRATFPMQTVSKCKLLPRHSKYLTKISKGIEVYRYYKGVEKEGEEAAIMPGKAGETLKVGDMDFVYITGGTFMMGSPDGEGYEDEYPRHKVTVDGFWIGRYEVTQAQYKAIMGTNPSKFTGKPGNPVEQVSWLNARDYCDRFSDKFGVTARLPFEAEWEYAARGGTQTRYYWGNSSEFAVINQYAVYEQNSFDKGKNSPDYGTHIAGSKTPNDFGIFDMIGNVSEFCGDWYDDWDGKNYYTKSADKNPYGALSGTTRVIRGGSWKSYASLLRTASRSYAAPGNSTDQDGFRIVLTPVQ